MWKWLKFVIILIIIHAASAKDLERREESVEDVDMSETDRQGWSALQTFQNDDSLWLPQERLQESTEVPIQKRRRLRKRKRKPTPSSLIEDNLDESFSAQNLPIRRRLLPQSQEESLEPWMAEEAIKRPNIRRRVTPGYLSSEEPKTVPTKKPEHFPLADEVVEKSEPRKTTIPDLRAVLKQAGTGSLSEILQQKNLSLSELLMGNQRAISALTETSQQTTEPALDVKTITDIDTSKYRRVPPSIGLRKDINRNFEQEGESMETLSSKEMLEAQRKRLSLLSHKDNKLFPTVTKYDVVTEPTTERRIFVPSHPKYYTSLVYRPDFTVYSEPRTESIQETTQKEIFTTTTTSTTTTPKTVKSSNTLYVKPKLTNLPLTNAKLNKITTTATFKIEDKEEENYPKTFNFPKPVPINIKDVAGFEQQFQSDSELNSYRGPLKMSINLDYNEHSELSKQAKNPEPPKTLELENNSGPIKIDLGSFIEKYNPEDTHAVSTTMSIESTTEESREHNVIQATAKDEILEIIRDPISRERLSRILEHRNMTLEELVEQRERGSSQLHLADIFHNKTREPEPEGEPFVGTVSSEYFNSFPLFGRQPKSRIFEENKSSDYSSTSNPSSTISIPKTEEVTPVSNVVVTGFPAVKIRLDKTENPSPPFLWGKFEPHLFSQFSQNNNKETGDNFRQGHEVSDDVENEIKKEIEEMEPPINSISSLASNEVLSDEDIRFQPQEDGFFMSVPSGVKSAIIVSLSIISLSIVVFLTILLIFKWTQRHSKKINYCNSLSSKIKSPMIIQRRPTTAIKSFVTETLGRKKNYYKSNMQSTDDLWECGRERIPSF